MKRRNVERGIGLHYSLASCKVALMLFVIHLLSDNLLFVNKVYKDCSMFTIKFSKTPHHLALVVDCSLLSKLPLAAPSQQASVMGKEEHQCHCLKELAFYSICLEPKCEIFSLQFSWPQSPLTLLNNWISLHLLLFFPFHSPHFLNMNGKWLVHVCVHAIPVLT